MTLKLDFHNTDELLVKRLENVPVYMKSALRRRLENLTSIAVQMVRRSIHSRSGHLASRVRGEVLSGYSKMGIKVSIRGVPYARIQEEGGRTPPHEIYPLNAKALAFQMLMTTKISAVAQSQGASSEYTDTAIVAHVNHPGGEIHGQHHVADATQSLKRQFQDAVKESIKEGWR